MKCSKCNRRAFGSRDKCMYCGGSVEASNRVDAAIDCPGCGALMTKETMGKVTIDRCERCNGTWYDRSEMEHCLKAMNDEPPTERREGRKGVTMYTIEQTTPTYRKCARCDQMMARKNYERFSGVIIDVCRAHGVYLDDGEFERIRTFLDTGGKAFADDQRAYESDREQQRQRAFEQAMDNLFPQQREWIERGYYERFQAEDLGPGLGGKPVFPHADEGHASPGNRLAMLLADDALFED